MPTCLIVDDDPSLRTLVAEQLTRYGLAVRTADSARAMRAEVLQGGIDLVLLDLMLPDGNGIDLCRELRQSREARLPVIMLTAQGDPISRVVGLEMGADDYVAKPFEPRELVARIQAVLRRSQGQLTPPPPPPPGLSVGGWQVDWRHRMLTGPDGVSLPLSNAEYRLLVAFAEHPDKVLSRARLVELTKAAGGEANERSVDLAVSRLRQKLGDSADHPRLIRTVRGQGYRFVSQPEREALAR